MARAISCNLGNTDWLDIIGRLAPGADPKSIETQMQLELRQWLLGPESKLQPGERELVPKQTLHLSPGGAGVQMMRDEYQSGLAPADVGFRLRTVDRLRQRGEPDAGAGRQPPAAHFRANRTGRTAVAADGAGTDGEHGSRPVRRNRGSGVCVLPARASSCGWHFTTST